MKITKKRFNVITQIALAEAIINIFEQQLTETEFPGQAPVLQQHADAARAAELKAEHIRAQGAWVDSAIKHITNTIAPGTDVPYIQELIDSSVKSIIAAASKIRTRGSPVATALATPAAATSPLGGPSPLAGEAG